MIEIIHIIVALLAALAITILSLFQDITFYALSIRLVMVIPVFFIFGLLLKAYLKNLLTPKEKPKELEPNESEKEQEELDEIVQDNIDEEDYS